MNSTGFIRNIDELGRVVIPKNVRKELGIKEYDAFEIFIDGDTIILKKCEVKKQQPSSLGGLMVKAMIQNYEENKRDK